MNKQDILIDLQPGHDFFIGIDSDGCAFDTMEIKQKECFCPNFIKFWELQPIATVARQTWEFVNLYSKSRGINRFLAVVEVFRLLAERKEVAARNFILPDISALTEWTHSESRLGNPTLTAYAATVKNAEIDRALAWSKKVNEDISDLVYGIPPFPMVKACLERLHNKADMIVVSQTPLEALKREWEEHKIEPFTRVIAGQEYGTKTEHLKFAAKGKYPDTHILMIGDAPGDLKAARSNGVLFFPINPGSEEASWQRFYQEGIDRFLNETFVGAYQDQLLADFDQLLPEKPHWV